MYLKVEIKTIQTQGYQCPFLITSKYCESTCKKGFIVTVDSFNFVEVNFPQWSFFKGSSGCIFMKRLLSIMSKNWYICMFTYLYMYI